ncbi:MAG: VOC family protein [Dehalococcoidia bacterium]|nr:VOC family protein [Dehalococcoidia bacterium]
MVSASVTAYLCAKPSADAIDFYKRAFGGDEPGERILNEDGSIGHAEIVIGDTSLYIADEWPEGGHLSPQRLKGSPVSFVLAVEDADATFQRAVDAGATVDRPPMDEPYGRAGWVIDPFGHRWSVTSPLANGDT